MLENVINDQFYKVIVNRVKDDILSHITEHNLLNTNVNKLNASKSAEMIII